MATWAEQQKIPKGELRTATRGKRKGERYTLGFADYAPKNAAGLKLRVFASGRRVWYIRGRIRRAEGEGEPRFVVLGEAPGMSREQAEAEAAKARDMLRQGKDPSAERDAALRAAEASRKTFGEVAAEWTAANKADWRPATVQARRHLFKGPRLAPIRDKPIGDKRIGDDIKALAKQISRNSLQSALGPVRSVFLFAVERGYIAKSPFSVELPKSEGNAHPMGKFQEGRAPDLSELAACLDAIDAAEPRWPLSPWWNIFRVCIFTGQRPSAVIGLQWEELVLDGDEPKWNLPAARSKIKRDSEIPLSKDCAAILRNVPRKGDHKHVWPGRGGDKPLSYPQMEPQVVTAALDARGFREGFTMGRARDTVSSWLDFQSDATERAMALLLDHKPPADNTRRRHYAKIGAEHQARVLIERWAAAVRDARAGKAARVVPMRRS